jgi:hypothetical protein
MVQLVQAFSPSPMPTPPQMAHSCIGVLRQGAGERAGPDQQVKPARAVSGMPPPIGLVFYSPMSISDAVPMDVIRTGGKLIVGTQPPKSYGDQKSHPVAA